MTKRIPVSQIQNLWHDAQTVDKNDMDTEQNYNNQTNAAIVNNFFGSGVLVNSAEQNVLFDSDHLDSVQAAKEAANSFDGTGINAATQPADNNLGNQLEVELTESDVFGRLSVKVVVIGLAFDGSLIYDRLTFHRNEKQVTANHYKQILTLIFNDFKGNNNCSRNNGGRVVVREALSFELSRDPIMVAQDVEPNIFFRDFKVVDGYTTLHTMLQNAIGSAYNVDDLVITTTQRNNREIDPNDVTTQIGQKFKATTNNIQKITFLMGVFGNNSAPIANKFDWAGDLIVSVYPLQTTVSCPTDIVPALAIDFDPAQTPLVEVSFNQAELKDLGYILTDVAQPIDFIFNSTKIAAAGGINIGNYYAITFRRSGSANSGTIFAESGNDRTANSRLTIFSGTWVDTNEEDLWFQIWTDAAKVADGQGFDSGNGILFDKTTIDEETGAVIDNQERYFSFSTTGQGTDNTGVIQAIELDSVTIQDERTGNNTFSRKQFVPSFSFVSNAGLASLNSISEPLIVGCVSDNNPKINPILNKTQTIPGLVKGDNFCIINPDPDLLSLQLIGSKLIPNSNKTYDYRIFKVNYCVDGYGDVNGDGIIDASDVARASELIGESITSTSTQAKIVSGEISTLELLRAGVNGTGTISSTDVNLIQNYVNRTINSFPVGSSFNHLCLTVQQSVGRADGYFDCTDGYVRLDGYISHNKVLVNSLDPNVALYDGYLFGVSIDGTDSAFNTVPFTSINYQIKFQSFWQDYLLILNSNARLIPTTFTYQNAIVPNNCNPNVIDCQELVGNIPSVDVGRNDFFAPDNLIIGTGELLRPDGSNYKIDSEIATITLELPTSSISEKSINIFNVFCADTGNGKTSSGYTCLKYADCSTVQPVDLAEGRIKFAISVQSYATSNDVVAVFVDPTTGLMTLSSTIGTSSSIHADLRTKILITVYLKKGGWVNSPVVVANTQVAGLFS